MQRDSALEPIAARPLMPRQADSDSQMIELWLYGRSPHTQRAYRRDAGRFLGWVGKPLGQITLGDLQAFADSLATCGLARGSQGRILAAVKSLLATGHRLGYLTFDVGRALRLPADRNTLSERILSEAEVQRILALEQKPRNRLLLRVLYGSGVRVSELCRLRWRDVQPRGEGAVQITVFGKGAKTRAVLLPASLGRDLLAAQRNIQPDDPVFRSQKGGALDPSAVLRIVRKAARKAGIDAPVSPHWFRHAHATHALERGAPIHLVQATLGHSSVAVTGAYLHARPTESSGRFLVV